MVSINFRPDDLGTRALKRDNQAPSQARSVGEAQPTARVREEGEANPGQVAQAAMEEGQTRRRRGPDRRQRNIPVLFDMRSGQERRQLQANPEQAREAFDEDQPPQRPPGLGIDEFA